MKAGKEAISRFACRWRTDGDGAIRPDPPTEWAIVLYTVLQTIDDGRLRKKKVRWRVIVVRYATGRPSVLRMASTILYVQPVQEKVEPGVIV
jgi:hypothetical protein